MVMRWSELSWNVEPRRREREGELLVLVRERANREGERENELNERDEGELCVDDFGL